MEPFHIVWHDSDLRVHDNPALVGAAEGGTVLPLYIDAPLEGGEWVPGAASRAWLTRSLRALNQAYKDLGSTLVIRKGASEKVLMQLVSEFPVASIHWNVRYVPLALKRDLALAQKLQKKGVEVHCYGGNYLISPPDVLNQSGKPYGVFTPFCRAVLAERGWRKPLPAPRVLKGHRIKGDKLEVEGTLHQEWSPGAQGALHRLKQFEASDYEASRNLPAIEGTSKLSPHLHFGEISPHEVITKHTEPSFVRQIIWREFGNYLLYHHPDFSDRSWNKDFRAFPWKKKKVALRQWQEGETGYPIVDAGMQQLKETGWMHNRVRMVVASFLTKDLLIDWREGAKWFWEHLVDADLANNSLGWQWVAGCGPDAAPYFRVFNPVTQSKTYDPEGKYLRSYLPLLKDVPQKWIHAPWEMAHSTYPPPIVDHAQARKEALSLFATVRRN